MGGFYKIPGTRPLKDLLHGTWPLRHPLHPALTDVVVGGYVAVALLDALYLWQSDAALLRPTDAVLVLTLVFSLASILSGLTDWNDTYGNERRLGILHGVLMTVVSLGSVWSLWVRVNGGGRETAIWLSFALLVVLLVASHLGGEMVFGFGTGVDRQAWARVPAKWTRIDVVASALEDRKPVRARAGSFDVMIVKLDGDLVAMGAACTHASGPLEKGTFVGRDRRDIQCPLHASVFSLRNGAALHGPATIDEPMLETRAADDGYLEVRAHG
ncbi:MAG: Rieske 2Fe-2S domain-containing protein [Chloroflexi bacterium]|nr:Rieske 2Fe-2S domain-containing protein [Chloroflexota bacterium]